MTSSLVERIVFALRNSSSSPWLPGLTVELVEAGWQDLYNKALLSPDLYGTARVIARDTGAPRTIISWLPMFSGDDRAQTMLQIETLEPEFAHNYNENGVKFYTAGEIYATNVLPQLREAITILKTFPTLLTTVAALVRSIHLLDSGDDDYDVSFSEPHIPFSIFVSVPQVSNAISALRVAEAFVHEAMHLQLTLIEKIVPLITTTRNKYFSPWRREYRTAQGVMHALYVFRVINEFLGMLPTLSFSAEAKKYIKGRRAEIDTQIQELQSFQNCPELTTEGAYFIRGLVVD